jgi:hypothetical protein
MHNSQRLGDFRQRVCRFQEVFAFVGGADNRAQARLAFRHRWIADCRCEYASLEELARKLEGLRGISNVNGNDRRLAGFELKAALL